MANEQIVTKLQAAFSPTHLEIIDNSWQHAGHVAMRDVHQAEGTHLAITLVSPAFEGVNRLDRHRKVFAVLSDDFAQALHALELKVYSPAEWMT